MKVFYDTSSLLRADPDKDLVFPFYISSITLQEIEGIKGSSTKDEGIKFKARRLARFLLSSSQKFTVIPHNRIVERILEKKDLPITNDNLIMASAHLVGADILYSEDINLILMGRLIFGLTAERAAPEHMFEAYTGYKEISTPSLTSFKKDLAYNINNSLVNEYLIVKEESGKELTEVFKWTGRELAKVSPRRIRSLYLGEKIEALDYYQLCAIDSLFSNKLTVIGGRAGSGKSFLSIATALNLIETHIYDKLIVLANPLPLRGTRAIGYLPGSKDEKLLSGNIGNILSSKFGDKSVIKDLITDGAIEIVNAGDCRGMEVKDREILYWTEAQNSSIDLVKMILQRAAEGAKLILEGDFNSQVDSREFEGESNGLRRVIQTYKGSEVFGYSYLPTIYRSRVAEIAENLST